LHKVAILEILVRLPLYSHLPVTRCGGGEVGGIVGGLEHSQIWSENKDMDLKHCRVLLRLKDENKEVFQDLVTKTGIESLSYLVRK
jgi:hypothetical protein